MSKLCLRCLLETMQNGRCRNCGSTAAEQVPTDPSLLPPGTKLDNGNIIVGMPLGRGGFGATYIARDLPSNQLIVLKEFLPQHLSNGRDGLNVRYMPGKEATFQRHKKSFLREAKILGTLRHPNIVSAFFSMEENNTAYYGMELLRGQDLAKWSRKRLPLPAKEIYEILAPVMDALTYVHTEGKTLHRDISPDNIFIHDDRNSPNGISPCLIDFGAAFCAKRDFTLSVPGVKKSGYSPLEQNWDAEHQKAYTDVYALGATVYYLLTGKTPPPADERQIPSAVGGASSDRLQPPSFYNRAIPPSLDRFLLKALALRPTERVQTMQEFKTGFANAIGYSTKDRTGRTGGMGGTGGTARPAVRLLLSMAADWLIFMVLPSLLRPAPDTAFFGSIAMLGLNTVLSASGYGTMGQMLLGLRLDNEKSCPTLPRSFVYNLLRGGFIAVIDELISMLKHLEQSALERWAGFYFVLPAEGHANPEQNNASSAVLFCQSGCKTGSSFLLNRYNCIGRGASGATITFPETETLLSHRHCELMLQDGIWYIKDSGSRNGTIVNNQPLTPHTMHPLTDGAVIRIGKEVLIFRLR